MSLRVSKTRPRGWVFPSRGKDGKITNTKGAFGQSGIQRLEKALRQEMSALPNSVEQAPESRNDNSGVGLPSQADIAASLDRAPEVHEEQTEDNGQ